MFGSREIGGETQCANSKINSAFYYLLTVNDNGTCNMSIVKAWFIFINKQNPTKKFYRLINKKMLTLPIIK